MRPVRRRIGLALALPALLVVAVGPVAAAPAPTYSVSLGGFIHADGIGCTMTAKATWKNTRTVDTVVLDWYFMSSYVATGTAPGSGPNDGTIKGKAASFQLASRLSGPPALEWTVTARFYAGGVLQGEASDYVFSLCY